MTVKTPRPSLLSPLGYRQQRWARQTKAAVLNVLEVLASFMCLYQKDKSPFHLIMLPDQALKLLVLMHDYPLYFQSSM